MITTRYANPLTQFGTTSFDLLIQDNDTIVGRVYVTFPEDVTEDTLMSYATEAVAKYVATLEVAPELPEIIPQIDWPEGE